jgi:hypothetical protein
MDRIINWLLLTIIFVFDPLAIALVIAANFAFDQVKSPKFIPQPIRIRQPKKVKMSVPEGMEFGKEYPIPSFDLKQRVKESQEKLKKEGEFGERMDIIGQNGNDGLHYDEYDLNKDGVIDKEEEKYRNAVEELKKERIDGGWDSNWYNEKLSKIKKPSPKNNK